MSIIHYSQKFEVSFHLDIAKSETDEMVETDKGLLPSHWLSFWEANVVTDALSRDFLVNLVHLHAAFVPLLLNMKIMGISLD